MAVTDMTDEREGPIPGTNIVRIFHVGTRLVNSRVPATDPQEHTPVYYNLHGDEDSLEWRLLQHHRNCLRHPA